MTSRKPYAGNRRKLVVGIDVGTTFSGVSYCILDPDAVPVIQGVNRFPAQEKVGGDAKIPSILYYDKRGNVRAVGAEALMEITLEQAEEEQWTKVEWFKLQLRPRPMADMPTDKMMPSLPPGKTVVQVFGDYLRYLYQCTRTYIQETHASGFDLWRTLEQDTEFVLTHPNGWEGLQQTQMRSAAIHGGLIPSTPEGSARVQFVTEGEASLHYCIGNNYASDVLQSGNGVIIVDAGGGTVDLSAYRLKEMPNWFEEIAPATCHFQGSVFVTRRARIHLENKLYASRYGAPDDIAHIADCFDKTTKLGFKDASHPSFIRFGSSRDKDESVNIKLGQLKLQGSEVGSFFEPSITAMKQAVQEQKAAALVPVTSVLLVGGFAASDWLFTSLQTYTQTLGLRLSRPDGHLGKAVADGAVSFYLDRLVTSRVARMTFGIKVNKAFHSTDSEHLRRSGTVFTDAAGDKLVPKGYSVILTKGTRVSETTVFKRSYHQVASQASNFSRINTEILVYRGNKLNPEWTDVESEMYTPSCAVTADIATLAPTLRPLTGKNGQTYYRFDYEIELHFGLTEHKAQVCWKENGQEKRGPARMVYDQGVGNRTY